MDLIDVDEFLTYYYRSPAPERAAAVLAWYVASEHVMDQRSSAPAAYFFARLAQLHQDLVPEYDRVRQDAPPAGRDFVAGIVRQLTGTPSEPTNALERSLETATENDLLWAEFMLTGSDAPIATLIGQLERPDIVREKLERWFGSWLGTWFGSLFGDRRTVCAQLHSVAGIVCDPDSRAIGTAGDLDCMCMLDGVNLRPPARFAAIRDALPFRLTRREVELIGAKATAKWSLASNANRHPAVLDMCEKALARSEGRRRAALEEIVQVARDGRRAFDDAMTVLEQAKAGDAAAQCHMGMLYRTGNGVPRSSELAAAWYHRAAKQGVAEAHELDGETPRWFRAAAEQGHARAQYEVGMESDDDVEAVKWFQLAAEQGLPEAQFQLGDHYLWGSGIRRDYVAAVRWFRKAADQGLAEAEHALGEMCDEGGWLEQDRSEAAEWYLRAAKHGYEPAQEALGEMVAEGAALRQDPQELRKWSIAPDAVYRRCPRCEDSVRPLLDGTCGSCGEQIAPRDTRSPEELGRAAQTMSTRSRSDVPCAVIAGAGLTALIGVLVLALVL